MRRISTLAALLVMVGMLHAGAQQDPPAGASIEGITVDKATARPIEGVRLTIADASGQTLSSITATSDADGRFVFKGLPPGHHRITTSKDGYAPAKPGSRKTPASGVFVSVLPDQQVKDIVVLLIRHAVITGRVIDTNGSPVVNAEVAALPVQAAYDEFGDEIFSPSGGARTDDNGEFRVFGLDPGEYYVRIQGAASGQQGLEGLMFPSYVLYYLSGADPSRAEPVLVRSGEEISLANIYAPVMETGPVRVNLTTDVPNLPDQVRMMQFRPRDFPLEFTVLAPNRLNGGPAAIEQNALPLGTNEVRVALDIPEGRAYGETTFELKPSLERRTVDLHIRKGVRFQVQVLLEKADGLLEPASGIRVSLRSVNSRMLQFNAQTGANGTVSFGSTPEMEYRLTVPGLAEDMYVARVTQDGKTILPSALVVAGDTRVEVVVRSDGGAVNGVVSDSAGKSVSGALVALVPLDPAARGRHYLYRSASSDQHGKFALTGIAPGSYKLFAWIEASGAGPFRNEEFLAKYEDRGREIEITNGQHAGVDVKVADEEP